MAAGYPVKVDYVTGDVLTATNLNDLAGTVNLYDPTAKGDLFPAISGTSVGLLAVGANATVLTADSTAATGMKWAAAGGGGGGGKVLQVLSGTYSTEVESTSTTYANTGLSLAITPTVNTSKILILISQPTEYGRDTVQAGGAIILLRNSTTIYTPTGANFHESMQIQGSGNTTYSFNAVLYSISYLDSPATTSETTYKTQFRVQNTANLGHVRVQDNGATASIILLEIGA